MIGIVGHVDRLAMVQELAGKVGAEYASVDDGTLGCERNHLKVWQHLADHNPDEWSIVLEDDAIPCDDFRNQLDQALAAAPSDIASFYLGHPSWWHWYPDRLKRLTKAGGRADQNDACWILTDDILHGVATAIHTAAIPEMLSHVEQSTKPIDYSIRQWARDTDRLIAFSWPSLVDHRDERSIVKHQDGKPRTLPRKAWHHGARDHWTNTTATL